jgi:hypothetical protein
MALQKNPITSSVIEPVNFRLVSYCLKPTTLPPLHLETFTLESVKIVTPQEEEEIFATGELIHKLQS